MLNAIYETDFLGFSYGFRPGRSPHHALDALYAGLLTRKVNWVLDLDIRGFFDAIDHGWLGKFVEHRIADDGFVRLIQKWLNAGVLEDGQWTRMQGRARPGGQCFALAGQRVPALRVRPLGPQWRTKHAHGDMIVVRYADDFVVGFQHRSDAERFQGELGERLAKFGLELHPEKTRLMEFGPFAAERRERAGRGSRRRSTSSASRTSVGRSEERTVHGGAADDAAALAGEAERGQSRAAATHARPDSRGGRVAEDGRRRTPAVLRGAHEPAGVVTFRFQVGRLWYRTLRRRRQNAESRGSGCGVLKRWLPSRVHLTPTP